MIVYGTTYDEAITNIRITLDNGETINGKTINRGFLAAVEGEAEDGLVPSFKLIEGLNGNLELVVRVREGYEIR